MAYFNAYNDNLYSTWTASDEFNAYPFLNQMSATEEANTTLSPFADGWNMGGEPGHMADYSRGLGVGPSLGKSSHSLLETGRLTREFSDPMASVAPYEAQTHDNGGLSSPWYYWPVADQYYQSHHPGIVNQDNYFTGVAASEASTVVSAPNSGRIFPSMKL